MAKKTAGAFMSKKIKVLIIIASIVVVLAVAVGVFFAVAKKSLDNLNAMTIEDIDLSTVPDGTYNGSYSAFPVSAEVEVTVLNHTITEIKIIKHDEGKGEPAEAITDRVISAQSIYVDAVSGATLSSKVIIMAIKDALTLD
jgi:uncharacterized protein with FMN-binding domain